MKKSLLKILAVTIAFLSVLVSTAQYTTKHYIAPSPWGYFDQYNEIVVTTLSTTPVTVTIASSDGTTIYSNSLTTVSGTPLRYRFAARDAVANLPLTILSGQGLIVSAASPIGVQVRNIASDDYTIAGSSPGDLNVCIQKGNTSFTSLGDQGLGTAFRVGYYANVTGMSCYSDGGAVTYSVMAINNGTNVYVNNSLLTTLNAGQAYLFFAPLGSLVTANNSIVVNTGMRSDNSGGGSCYDGVESQVIPVANLGTNYVVVRSQGNVGSGYERSTIIASVANTTVTVTVPKTGKTTTYTLPNAGSYVTINNGDSITPYSSSYITASSPVIVFTGTAATCEADMIVQSPLNNCAGSFNVQTVSFLDNSNGGNAILPYFGYVIIQSDTAIVYFNGQNLENIVGKRTAIGTSGYYIIQYTNAQLGNPATLQFYVNARINVALVESGAGFSMAAYISSISSVMPPPSVTSNCLPSTLTAQSGFSSYQWYNGTNIVPGATSQNYSPSSNGAYSVSGITPNCGTTPISTAVLVNPKPNAGVDQIVCAGSIATLSGTSTVTGASWVAQPNDPSGYNLSSTNNGVSTVLFSNSAVGNYNFIYDAGCTDTMLVTVKPLSTSTTNATICSNSSYTFNGVTYNTAGTYVAHLNNSLGCDSAATLNLTVKNATSSTKNVSICSGSSFTFNGTSYNTSGTYTVHLTNSVGCDSVATLVLSVNSSSTSTTNASICNGSSYTFNGSSYSTAGTYVAHLTNSVGCDSAATLVLTIKLPSTSSKTASICNGSSYTFNGVAYTTSGTYVAHLTNSVGCDSAATLVLTVKSNSSSTTNASVVSGNSYLFNGISYTNSGTYTVHLTNAAGCDSAATLVLTVTTLSSTSATICAGSSYLFNGTSYSTSGTYTYHTTNSKGGDSIATLVLVVKPTTTSTTNVSICNGGSYTFNGSSYTAAGTYIEHLTNSVGCDSTATLVLTVKQLSTSTTNASICSGSSYTFNGTSYTTAGTYVSHLTNAVGCDSAATLVLTIKSLSTSTTTASICSGSSYTFNGTAYTTAGTYVAHLTNSVGCDSAATLVLTVKAKTSSTTTASICSGNSYTFNGTTYSTSGTYTVHFTNNVGCDSAANLVLTVNPNPTVAAISGNSGVCVGSTTTFTDATTGGVWSSVTPSTATINSAGVITGLYGGSANITYTVTSAAGCITTVSKSLNINSNPSVTSITGTTNVCLGAVSTLSDASFGGTWSSGSTSIATISAGGVVTGVSVGSSVISYSLSSSSGCTTTVTTNVSVGTATTSTTSASICNGGSYTFNGTAYTTAGTYVAHLTNAVGCDSAATLVLTVKSLSTSTTSASICNGGSYTFNGTTYTTAGTYVAHLPNAVGCDSAATLVLTVKSLSTSTTTSSICDGGSYTFNGTSYTTAGTYISHLTNAVGCDSAATLVLTVKSLSTSITNASICNGVSYTFNGNTYTSAGTYVSHLTNAVGCDSAATLVLTVKSLSTSTTTSSICDGGSYTFNGTTYTTAGTYISHLTNAVGCDSAATLVLTVKSLSTSITNASICNGGSYTFNGNTYTSAGTYVSHLTNAVGCDSAATLVLTVKSLSASTTSASICNGGSYTFNGTAYTTAGTYVSHLTNAVGCDSAATFVLTVKSLSTSTTTASICDGGSYTFNGNTYTTAGTYVSHLTNAVGCDSAATLVLTVKSLSASTTSASICNGGSYTFNGTAYTTAGTYVSHLTNAVGCDSAATLVLTVKYLSTSTTTASICDGGSYTFNGTTYTSAGTYVSHLTNAVGCDSAATLVLTVKSLSASTTSASICNGGSYTFNGNTYATAGTYVLHLTNAVGCDSAATLVLTVKSLSTSTTTASICSGGSYTFNGTTYTTAAIDTVHLINAAGCDSLAILNLTSAAPVAASFAYTSTTVDNTPCLTGNSISFTNTSVGATSYKWYISDSLVSTKSKASDSTFTAANTYNVELIASNNSGCSDTITQPVYIYSCSVSSGGTGGLESKSLGAAIGTRNYNMYKNSKNGAVQYTDEQKIVAPKKGSYGMFGGSSSVSLASLMPYQVNSNYVPYDQSASVSDLESITNAVDVRAIDFTSNNLPKAVAFATKTIGGIYSHTKPICDRLKGAQLLDITNVTIKNLTFIQYKIQQPNGDLEFAISFSAGQKVGRSTLSIQSNWLMPDYVSEDTMFNYQLWAANPVDVATMVSEVLSKLQTSKPLIQLNDNDLPSAYVSAANRQGTTLNLTVNNRTSNTSGFFQLAKRSTENNEATDTVLVPFTISANAKTTVSIPVSDTYDANISMLFNNNTTDMLYMADGIWGTSGDNNTTVSQFSVINKSSRQYASDEYPLLRDVQVQVTTPSYLTIYKYLKGGAASVDLSSYKSFHFTTSTNTEGMSMKVTITKLGVGNWSSQYSYTINNLQDGQTYKLALSDFKSTDGTLPATIDASDITSVVYNLINTTGQSLSIKAGISNAAFSTEDIAYQQALQVKTVSISPNPNNGNFKVSFESPAEAQLHLAIVDISGRIISNTLVNAVVGKNEVSVNVGMAAKGGIYYVSLQGAGTKYNTQKMIIK